MRHPEDIGLSPNTRRRPSKKTNMRSEPHIYDSTPAIPYSSDGTIVSNPITMTKSFLDDISILSEEQVPTSSSSTPWSAPAKSRSRQTSTKSKRLPKPAASSLRCRRYLLFVKSSSCPEKQGVVAVAPELDIILVLTKYPLPTRCVQVCCGTLPPLPKRSRAD